MTSVRDEMTEMRDILEPLAKAFDKDADTLIEHEPWQPRRARLSIKRRILRHAGRSKRGEPLPTLQLTSSPDLEPPKILVQIAWLHAPQR